jgi:hypothetical protein
MKFQSSMIGHLLIFPPQQAGRNAYSRCASPYHDDIEYVAPLTHGINRLPEPLLYSCFRIFLWIYLIYKYSINSLNSIAMPSMIYSAASALSD